MIITCTLLLPVFQINTLAGQNSFNNSSGQDDRAKPRPGQPTDLPTEVRNLTNEVKKLNSSQQQIVQLMIINLIKEKIEKLDDKRMLLLNRLENIKARQEIVESKLRNIAEEISSRNLINRQEAERVVKNELNQELQLIRIEREKAEREFRLIRSRLVSFAQIVNQLRQFINSDDNRVASEAAKQKEFEKLLLQLLEDSIPEE